MTPDNGAYMHAAYVLVVLGVVGYVVSVVARSRALARRAAAAGRSGTRGA